MGPLGLAIAGLMSPIPAKQISKYLGQPPSRGNKPLRPSARRLLGTVSGK